MRIHAWTICFAAALCGLQALGQTVADETIGLHLGLRQISIDQGLSQGMINDLALDSTGYLWVATKDGLNRYDGSGFKVFRHEPDNPHSISENFISNLHVDEHGRLWVATQSRGLNLFDPYLERFLHINSGNSNLSSDFLGELKEDNDGNILVQTLDRNGYDVISVKASASQVTKGSIQIASLQQAYPGLWTIGADGDWSKDLDFDSYGAAWYAYKDTVYYVAEPKHSGCRAVRFAVNQSVQQLKEDGSKYIISQDRSSVYRIDSTGVVSEFNRDDNAFCPIFRSDRFKQTKGRGFLDKRNDLWAFDHNLSLLSLNCNRGILNVYQPNWEQFETGVRNHRAVGLEDNAGDLWIGTGGNGLLHINRESLRFKKFNTDPAADGYPATDGSIRLFRTSTKQSKALNDPESAKNWLKLITSVRSARQELDLGRNYTHLSRDENGDFWISAIYTGLGKDCILRINGDSGHTDTIVCGASPDQARWFGHPIFMLSNGHIWFSEKGTDGGAGLYELNPSTGHLRTFEFPIAIRKYQYRLVSDWYEDIENRKLWLATTHGLFRFDLLTEEWTSFVHDATTHTGPTSNMLLSVAPDPLNNNVIWMGTEGAGLNRLDAGTGEFTAFTVADGLPNNVVYAIQPDESGNLWVSTNNGLARFRPGTEPEFSVYTKSDGLPGNEFNRYEFSTSASGDLYFGGTSGVVYFNPNEFNEKRPAAKVVINQLKILNRSVSYPDEHGILKTPIEHTGSLVFQPEQDMITFGFTMLDLSNPEKHNFKYRMLGYADDWIHSGNDRTATYTNLSPGEYTFQVMAKSTSDLWSTEPASVKLTILPPWYATWWFRGLMLTALLNLIYLLYRYRLEQMLRIERVRNDIAQDLHDEIGSTLSSVSLFSSVLKSRLNKTDKQSMALLDKIASSTTEMMESMNDMVWTIKADNDRFEHVINRMRAFAVNMCEAKGVQLDFTADTNADRLNLNMKHRKNLYLIFKEAVNNAIKYSGSKTLAVNIERKNHELIIRITDEGKGFDMDQTSADLLNLGGNGLNGMRKRAAEIGAQLDIRPSAGTCVEVRLPL